MNPSGTLFDSPPAGVAAIGPHTASLDRAAAAHYAGDQLEARQALGAYLVLRAIDRAVELSGDDDPDARDGLRFQVASVAKFVGELPKVGQIEANHLAGIADVLTDFARDGERRLRINLLAYSWYLEQAGHLEEALDVVAVSEPLYRNAGVHELTNFGMTAGRFHRTLAHWDLADRSYALGFESAAARQDARGMLLARLGRAKVMLGRGNLPEARRQIEGIIAEAEGKDLAEARAWGYADLAVVLERSGLSSECLRAQFEAFTHFRDAEDRLRVLGSLGVGLRMHGAFDAAKHAFETVIRKSKNWSVRQNSIVESLALYTQMGDELAFRRYKQEADAGASQMPPSMEVDYRVKVGQGLLRFDRRAAGIAWLEQARDRAEQASLNEWYFKIVEMLQGLKNGTTPSDAERSQRPESVEPEVAEVADRLLSYVSA